MQPFQAPEHEAGAEADGVPFAEVALDLAGILAERLPVTEQVTIVMRVVDTDLEPVAIQLIAQHRRHMVLPLGNEIEGGTETELPFHLHEAQASAQPVKAFDIMS